MFQVSEVTARHIPALEKSTDRFTVVDDFEHDQSKPTFIWGGCLTHPNVYYMESGYFYNACWIDHVGMYRYNSLNKHIDKILAYESPRDIIDQVLASSKSSKYNPDQPVVEWQHDVLIAQSPIDHSICYDSIYKQVPFNRAFHAGYERYMEWYLWMCETYRSKLYVKIHPVLKSAPDLERNYIEIAHKHGCECGYADLKRIIKSASMVHIYNSTVGVDCMMRDISFMQYADGAIPEIPRDKWRTFCNFLMWKYCLPTYADQATWYAIVDSHLSSGDDLWPIPEHLSWGTWALSNIC